MICLFSVLPLIFPHSLSYSPETLPRPPASVSPQLFHKESEWQLTHRTIVQLRTHSWWYILPGPRAMGWKLHWGPAANGMMPPPWPHLKDGVPILCTLSLGHRLSFVETESVNASPCRIFSLPACASDISDTSQFSTLPFPTGAPLARKKHSDITIVLRSPPILAPLDLCVQQSFVAQRFLPLLHCYKFVPLLLVVPGRLFGRDQRQWQVTLAKRSPPLFLLPQPPHSHLRCGGGTLQTARSENE